MVQMLELPQATLTSFLFMDRYPWI